MKDASRNNDVFGEGAGPAIFGSGNAQHFATLAKIHFAFAAIFADAAIDGGIESDAGPFERAGCTIPARGDCAGGLVTHHDRRNAAPRTTVVAVHVATADAARLDANQDLFR